MTPALPDVRMSAGASHGHRWPIVVPLARDPLRLIGWLLIRIAVGEVGLVVGLNTPGSIGTLVTIVSVVVLVYVVLLSIQVLSLRIEVYPGEVQAAAWPIRRRYRLTDGPATRLRVPPGQGRFKTQLGSFGIEVGAGLMRGGERVEVIRLAPTSSVVLVPTIDARLAIAPISEERLMRALAAASAIAPGQSPAAASR
jgi:hypothetical protein